MSAAIERSWPVILHYEFKAAGHYRKTLFEELNTVLQAHPGHPFLLIHMAQLNANEAMKLLKTHSNLHFLTSHSNPIITSKSTQPWINLFSGRRIKQAWKELMVTYPDQFVLSFDNVWADHWSGLYTEQAEIWREALSELPEDVASAIAYKNAVRLWNLEEPNF
ncbi:MAG: amidohydrolase family protein [Oceanicoccus sp.]|nr:amidohydrolase family protein [Oceanicoccus sp.]